MKACDKLTPKRVSTVAFLKEIIFSTLNKEQLPFKVKYCQN